MVIVEGIYSMEGDVGPLPGVAELAKKHGARLMVDEAHSVGVLGETGRGAAQMFGIEDKVDLRMGTFSKSFASCGGFIAGSAEVVDFLRVSSRSYIFTASGVPASIGATKAALEIIDSAEGKDLFALVLKNAERLSHGLQSLGFKVVENESGVTTPVVPVLVEDDWKAVLLWKALYDAGIFVNVALHPAVPAGGALLRTSVMATHDDAVIDQALEIFASVKLAFEAEHGPLPTG